jgi:hypothetical protein
MTRNEFESLPSREQRKVAEREYKAMSALIFAECKENGIFSDIGGQLTEIHHIWSRAKCPLWYVFQKENLMPISQALHFAIHNRAYSDMTKAQQTYYEYLKQVKDRLKQENDDYNNHRRLAEDFA